MSAQHAYETLTLAMLSTTPACADDDRFIDDDIDPHQVAHICKKCPLRTLCETYADQAKPEAGVWAGKKYTRKIGRPTK